MSMTDAELQERVEALAEKIRHDIVVVAANTMASTLLCEHDLVLYHAAMFAARAQGAKVERERCDKLAERAYRHAIRRQEDECTAECECCDYAISLLDALWGDICNPSAETEKEQADANPE